MNKSFVDLFEQQVVETPDNIAVVFEHEQLSYRGLNERANMLAHHLRNNGVKDETLVPLYLERGIVMIVGMLGIMKAGGAYVPIDTDFPEERISYMLKDTAAKMVVSTKKSSAVLKAITGISIIEVEAIKDQDKDNLPAKVLPAQLAYVIYTSGSTGTPKGVMIEHRNLVDYISGLTDKTQINECKSFALVSTIATDLGNTVIYGSLASGGSLHLFTKESVSDTEFLHQYFTKNKIDCLKIVPSHWKVLNMDDKLLLPEKLLVFGGEALQERVVESIRETGTSCRVVNHYGPTETTIGKLLHIVEADAKYEYTVPIGKPFSNTKVLILNKNFKLCPKGVPGELYITGDGVARGYLNNPDLTKEKFIQNPFSKGDYSIMYSTGDLVKYLPDGNIEFIGRVDNQVKIRGYRIELGEIESHLQKSGLVNNAVVIASEDKQGNKRLVAYIVPQGSFEREGIFSYLKEKLPEYMLPAIIIELDSLPLTPNGKIDRKALPEPEAIEAGDKYLAPRNEVEEKLVMIWQDVLEVDKIGINDDFFELGGHSLLAIRLISIIRKELQTEVKIGDLFDYPTIALLSEHLKIQEAGNLLPAIEIKARPNLLPLSFSQERLWFIDQLEGSIQYHISQALRIKGKLNREALGGALQGIVNRHEVLRTVILDQEGHPYQRIKEKDGWELRVVDGGVYKEDADGLRAYIEGLNKKPFDLSKDYMLRAVLIKIGEQEHILALTLHHIASDGWSRSVLIRELAEIYRSYGEGREAQLDVLPVQYADYAIWQRSYLQGETWERKIGYWKEKLEGISTLQLPTDYVRPAVQSTRGARENFSIDKEVSEGLHSLCRKEGTTMFMTLQAVVKVLLYRYSGQQDICIGTAIAGRQQQELEGLIGFFVNTLALRDEVDGAASFRELLQTVKATTLEAYEHQEVPFEKVVDVVVKERDLSRNPLFQVMFVLQNLPEAPQLQLGEVELSRDLFAHDTSRFDLTFTITEGDVLRGSVEYCTALYKKETIERMMVHFKELVGSVIREPDQRVGMLEMLSGSEKNQLLVEFNDTETAYPKEKTIIELFEDQVIKTPDAVALVFEEHTLTYKKLNERSNRLAHYLRERGVKAETSVPVCIERSIEMVVGILGILKAGGAYVPVDTEYPPERIGYILEDTGAAVVVSSRESREKLAVREGTDIIETDGGWPEKSSQQENLKIAVSADQLAYIIYTSGSTGKPKGVMVEHGSLVNYLLNSKARYVREDGGSSGSFIHLSCTFDASLTAMFMPLLSGKSIIVGSKHGVEVFEDSNLQKYAPYDFLKITPAHLELLQPVIRNGEGALLTERLVIGGEALRLSHFSYYIDKGIDVEIINEYGPTEATVGCSTYSFWTVRDQEKIKNEISIGKPIDNAQIYILGKNNELVPAGIDGEICVGGAGVARGYLNRDDLTAEKFIKDPFKKEEGARIYKTGDLGRWLLDGNIEYAGRKDDQVKIRGYRIELGEIESNVLQSGMVSQAVVVAREDKEGNKKLTGYVVPNRELIKAKEKELYSVQVATWKELYETEYGQTEGDESVDPEFNIIGWNDSFTGMANPAEQMQEWLQDIVEVIMAEDPGHVLEIGCGTGLIYYQLAGKVKKYIGADLSRSSINQITERIGKGYRNYGPTELQVAPAHEVTLKADEEVDTIILNSMVQYFPGEDYMNSVVEKSISLLKGKGRIIIGDVRDYRLLKLFKARLNLKKLQDKASINEFKWMLDQEVLKEEELCFSPDYFYQLQSLYPNITNVEIQWKHASYINELTLYRYTVVIHVGIEKELIEPEWKGWKGTNETNSIIEKFQQKDITNLALKDVPNPRLWKEKLLEDALNNKSVITIGDIITDKQDEESEGIDRLLAVAKTTGYHYRLLLNEDPLKMNVLIEQKFSSGFVKHNYIEKDPGSKGWNTNIPLFTDIGFLLQKDIKHFLQQRLPEYMIPLELISLDHLPLTTNGKIDRIFLNQREDKAATNKLNYQPARTETEQMLVTIWEKLLNADRIGIYDNFFDLGGHSLLATRTVSAIRKELEIEIAIKDLFIYPTIAKLSKYLQGQARGSMLPSIEVQERPERIPLSFSQERLWFIDQLDGSVQYHIPQVLRLRGNLNKETIKDALQTIVNRHEVLRTVIVEEEGHPYQQVKEKEGWELGIVDGREYREDAKGLQQCIYGLIKKPFDFSKDYMLRADLIEIEEQEHILVVTLHHIASDGWSTSVLVRELAEIYRSYGEGREARLAVLPVQYADYAIWQRRYLQGETWEKKIGYWKEKLGETTMLQLPTDYVRPAIQSTSGARESFSIDKEISEGLQLLNRKAGTTMFMTLLSVVKVLLYRYSGQQDICVGTAIAGRQQQELEGLIGFFVNTLALRDEVDSAASFKELLQSVKATTLEAYEHQEVPFERVVEAVTKERDLSRSPLFQVMFLLQNTPEVPRLDLGEVALSRETFVQSTSKFDLSFSITETGEGLKGSIQYCTDLYEKETIERMVWHFKGLLTSVVKMPEEKISKLHMLTAAEEQQLLIIFNDTSTGYPKEKNITNLFEEQAAKTPKSIAVVYEEEELTYSEMNERSNQLAHYLRKKGVKAETLVPICVERGIGMMIGILGILKSGGAYVPIDTEYPQDRISYMLEDTAAAVIVSSKASRGKLPQQEGAEIITIDTDREEISKESKEDLNIEIDPTSLAYIIYTSGSTGMPKGVMIEHKSLLNYLLNSQARYITKDAAGTGSFIHLSYTFDASITGMFMPLIWGKPVVIASTKAMNVFEDENLQKYAPYDFIKLTPSHLELITAIETEDKAWFTKKLVIGGEALHASHLSYFKERDIDVEIVNEYGPTETTVGCSTYKFSTLREEEIGGIPVGKPMDNTRIYITGQTGELLPVGVWGEIVIGGEGVARGYLNREELTKEKFIPDLFTEQESQKIYKTGDIGRWQEDGTIEYQGRKDDQVKIRGYRIELGEIENVLLQNEGIRQAVVLSRINKAGNKYLAAYIAAEGKFDKEEITVWLLSKLPEYMVPTLWMEVAEMPLTSNGKIDKRALPEADPSELISNEYAAPATETEEKLVGIWQQLLGVERVGIHDNFFELGGDSILTIQVVSRARRLGYALQPKDIFIHQTIARLTQELADRSQAIASGEQEYLAGTSGLLPIQQWYLQSDPTEMSHFNQSVFLKIDKTVDISLLDQAIEKIVNHHDALRFKYSKSGGEWHQEYGNLKGKAILENIETAIPDQKNSIIKELANKHQQSLNAQKGELIRVVLMKTSDIDNYNRLLIVIHHLAIDGISWRILMGDIELLLSGDNDLGYKSNSYREWFKHLETYSHSSRLLSQRKYWQKVTESYLQLPVDKCRQRLPKVKDTLVYSQRLGADQTRSLVKEVPRVYHTEINDILLSALSKTLCDWSKTDKIIIGLEGHGREEIAEGIDLSRTVGWFTSIYPLLLEIKSVESKNPDSLVKSVKEQLRQVPDKGIGYGVLKYISKEEALQGNDPWEILFNYLGQVDNVVKESKWFSGAGESAGAGRSEELVIKEKLSVNSIIKGGELVVSWTYSAKEYKEETIQGLADAFIANLESLIDHCLEQQKNGIVYTPSDYGLGDEISYSELDQFLNERL